jgi:hypothetical protein
VDGAAAVARALRGFGHGFELKAGRLCLAVGISSRSNPKRFGSRKLLKKLTPVILPPGKRLQLLLELIPGRSIAHQTSGRSELAILVDCEPDFPRPCIIEPDRQTSRIQPRDPNRKSAARSFDHLVGAQHEHGRNVNTDRLRGLEIDHQLEPRRLLDWHIGGLGAAQNLGR